MESIDEEQINNRARDWLVLKTTNVVRKKKKKRQKMEVSGKRIVIMEWFCNNFSPAVGFVIAAEQWKAHELRNVLWQKVKE